MTVTSSGVAHAAGAGTAVAADEQEAINEQVSSLLGMFLREPDFQSRMQIKVYTYFIRMSVWLCR